MVRLYRVRVAAWAMCHPQVIRSRQLMRHDGGNTLKKTIVKNAGRYH
jgi:hypothetical protein